MLDPLWGQRPLRCPGPGGATEKMGLLYGKFYIRVSRQKGAPSISGRQGLFERSLKNTLGNELSLDGTWHMSWE